MPGNKTVHKGSCSCGGVTVTAKGDPAMQLVCHCLNCQKSSGSGHNPIAAFASDRVEIKGRTSSWSYVADSGGTATSIFCPTCGSPIGGTTTSVPGITAVRVGVLEDSAFFAPQVAVYGKRKRAWDHDFPQNPLFDTMPPMAGK